MKKVSNARNKKLCMVYVQDWHVSACSSVKHSVGEEWFVNRGVLQRVMFSWISYIDSRHEMHGEVSFQNAESTVRRTLDVWKRFVHLKNWMGSFLQSKSSREDTDIAAKCLGTWQKAAQRQRSVRARTRKTLGKFMSKTTGVAFTTWAATVKESKRVRQLYAKAWHAKTRRLKATTFSQWARVTTTSRQVGKRTLQGMVKKSSRIEVKVLSCWRKYTATEAKLIRIWDKLCRRRVSTIRRLYFDQLVQYSASLS
jgi:hypothetical protein